jgi:hypothetical protein
MLSEIRHYMEASGQLHGPDRFTPLRRELVMTEMVGKVTKPVPAWNRSPEVQALTVTEQFGYKPDYSYFDMWPGQVSLFLLRVR